MTDYLHIMDNQPFQPDARFTIHESEENSHAVILKTEENMWSVTRGLKGLEMIVMAIIASIGLTILFKSIWERLKEDWDSVISGKQIRYLNLPIDQDILDDSQTIKNMLEEEAFIDLSSIKNVCEYMANLKNLKEFDHENERDRVEKSNFKNKSLEEAFTELSEENKGLPIQICEVEELEKVTDPSQISVARKDLSCSNGHCHAELDAAVAMRKGTQKLGTPKAMGEDAFVIDQISLDIEGEEYQIPFIATLDGGGGHVLAQHGRKELKKAFQENLEILVQNKGKINAFLIAEAMKRTDDQLFGKFDASGNPTFPGTGYVHLRENHQKLIDLGLSKEKVKGLIQNLKGILIEEGENKTQLLMMNPKEVHQALIEKKIIMDSSTIDLGGRTYDLDIEEDASDLQDLYELATGTVEKIEVQVVMNAFWINEQGELRCITYNRGDSMALCSQGDETKPLSKRVNAMETNYSFVALQERARVISACDGITEVISINELEEANQHPILKDKGSLDYVMTMMQASILTGSGDDKTIVSVKVKESQSI